MTYKKVYKNSEQRCKLLYKIGLEMFLKNGYEKTNLANIVKVAGGSLSTVYKLFGNKEKFFEAVVFDGFEEFFKELEDKLTKQKDQSLENFLYQFGREYLEIFSSQDSISLARILYCEGYKDGGKISKIFKTKNIEIIVKIFVDYFKSQEATICLKSDDYVTLAEEFCLLIREPEFTYSILGLKCDQLTKEQKDKKVKRVVEVFLNGYKKS